MDDGQKNYTVRISVRGEIAHGVFRAVSPLRAVEYAAWAWKPTETVRVKVSGEGEYEIRPYTTYAVERIPSTFLNQLASGGSDGDD